MDASVESTPVATAKVRVGEWREFDVIGAELPRRSNQAKWISSTNVLTGVGVTISIALLIACFVLFQFGIFAAAVFLLPGQALLRRYRKRFARSVVGEEQPANPLIAVGYEIDGFAYGADLGTLSFEGDWIHFEGERSTFSLGKSDVEASHENGFLGADSIFLPLLSTGLRVRIRIAAVSSSNPSIWLRIAHWRSIAKETGGIVSLPPLQPIRPSEFGRGGKWRQTMKVGLVALAASWFVFFGVLWGTPFGGVALWCTLGCTALAVAAQRMFTWRGRLHAAKSLESIRRSIAERAVLP